MNSEITTFAVSAVAERLGIGITSKLSRAHNEQVCVCTPVDSDPNESFSINFLINWRSAEAVFVPGKFSAALINRIGSPENDGKSSFVSFVKGLAIKRIYVQMKINGIDSDPLNFESWPKVWKQLELRLRTPHLVINKNDFEQEKSLFSDTVIPLLGMMVSLIGVEDLDTPLVAESEGEKIKINATRYERKKINREACIQLKGTKCQVCGFDFLKTYGALGLGYIEVHHIKPVSTIGSGYKINIEADLVPLCANCHAMAHREDPPISIERLQAIISSQRKS